MFLFIAHSIQKSSLIPDVFMHDKLIDEINKSFILSKSKESNKVERVFIRIILNEHIFKKYFLSILMLSNLSNLL